MKRIRKTKSVQLIIDAFKQDKAISIIELVMRFRNNMNKTTVYRILDRLEKSEILHSFKDQNGLKRYARNNTNTKEAENLNYHAHFLCEDCGISSCVSIDLNIPSAFSYTIKNSEHLLLGQCGECLPS